MNKTCLQCLASFTVTDSDLEFYDKISPVFNGKKYNIPPPTLCPDCRQQRRICIRNERTLYRRKSDLSGEDLLSVYSDESPLIVYEQNEWWSDEWDPKDYEQEWDEDRNFLDQFKTLMHAVPHAALFNMNCEENCSYVNIEYDDKNCYLCFGGGFCEDCYFGTVLIRSKNCVDCYKINLCEQCYELVDSEKCHSCYFSQNLQGCNDCWFCYDCQSCANCFECTGIRNKEYCYQNEQLSKEEYQKLMSTLNIDRYPEMQKVRVNFFKHALPNVIHKYARVLNSEECVGDYITNSKNCTNCFEIDECQDIKYVALAEKLTDSMDCYISGWPSRLCYDSMSQCANAHHNLFSYFCWEGSAELMYCSYCFSSQNCFGCIGLRHKQYCILNKQYSKEEYEELVPRIIKHMMETPLHSSTGSFAGYEWGEFFPVTMSPFAYNETIAQEYFPLSKEEVLSKGWKWKEQEDHIADVEKTIPANQLPESIKDIPDDILNWAIICEATNRPFKIIKQELEFYRQMNLPIPHFHPDERHRRRMALRNPRKLWTRKCDKCNEEMQTTYSPDRPEIVYCERCYLESVY